MKTIEMNDSLSKVLGSTRMDENSIEKQISDSAIAVHRELGPGLLETVYEVVLLHKLHRRGLETEIQVGNPVGYRNVRFDERFRADIVVEDKIILELKALGKEINVHIKQPLTDLRLTGRRLGYLLHFGEEIMKMVFSGLLTVFLSKKATLASLASWREE